MINTNPGSTPADEAADSVPVDRVGNTDSVTKEDSPAILSKPTNVEVHHHPDLHHKPKKWKEYFLEFLMIFLAVTMGFIAENIRENISNRENEKVYMESIIQDIKDDISTIDKQQIIFDQRVLLLDSLSQF